MADVTLDLRGLHCPLPILRAKKGVARVAVGKRAGSLGRRSAEPGRLRRLLRGERRQRWSKASRPTAFSASSSAEAERAPWLTLRRQAPLSQARYRGHCRAFPVRKLKPRRVAHVRLVADVHLLRRPLDRRQSADPRAARPRLLARSSVFDGARAFEGVAPDLDRHCARVNHSAETMWLKPTMAAEAIQQLAWDGIKKFAPGTQLYIRPMYWAERNGPGSVPPDPESTKFLLTIYEAPLTDLSGIAITRSRYAKPLAITMPIDAKAGCLYPNNARALMEARDARLRQLPARRHARQRRRTGDRQRLSGARRNRHDAASPTARSSTAITRQRVLKLLKADGVEAREATLSFADFEVGRRDLRRRQLRQGVAGQAHREPRPAARPAVPPRPPALLGLRPFEVRRAARRRRALLPRKAAKGDRAKRGGRGLGVELRVRHARCARRRASRCSRRDPLRARAVPPPRLGVKLIPPAPARARLSGTA